MACVTASVLNRERKARVAVTSPGRMKTTTSARWSAPTQRSVPGSADNRRSRAAAFPSPRRCQIRMSLSMYARIAGSVAPLGRVPERPPGSSNRRCACFAPLPRSEGLAPDVALFLAAQPFDPKLNGFFEKLPLGHPELPRHALHLVEGGFVEARREDFLHT